MIFKKTTEYAFRIIGFLARDKEKLYTTSDIYLALHIPFRYLRKQMTILTKTGLVDSVQGKHGGYKLAKKSKDITLWDIVDALGDRVTETNCFFGYDKCALHEHCLMHSKWANVKKMIEEVLKSTTLDELHNGGIQDLKKKNDSLLT